MLSSNSTLQNGRYRIIGLFGDTADGRIYDCYDDQLGQKVVMHESLVSDDFPTKLAILKSRRLDGVIRVREGFIEGKNDYMVTEAVESRASRPAFASEPSTSMTRMVTAIRSLLYDGIAASRIDITPLSIRLASDGHNSLIHFRTPQHNAVSGRVDSKLTPFGSLESIWSGLDLVTQKAISNSLNETSLDILESPFDERSCIYSLGASVYSIVSGKTPPDALVRTIEMLDGNADPLKSAVLVRSDVGNELSAVLDKMLKLRREDRYQSLNEVTDAVTDIIAAPIMAAPIKTVTPEPEDELDEFDLLEIPKIERPAAMVAVPVIEPAFPAAIIKKVAQIEAEPVDQLPVRLEPAVATGAGDKWMLEKEYVEATGVLDTAESTTFSFEKLADQKPSSAKKFMVAGAAGTVLIAGVIWGVMSFGTTTATQVSAQTESIAPIARSVDAEPQPTIELQSTPTTSAATTEVPQQVLPDQRIDQQKDQKRPVIAKVKPEPPAQPKPEKPKRSVTVDDLIRDN